MRNDVLLLLFTVYRDTQGFYPLHSAVQNAINFPGNPDSGLPHAPVDDHHVVVTLAKVAHARAYLMLSSLLLYFTLFL